MTDDTDIAEADDGPLADPAQVKRRRDKAKLLAEQRAAAVQSIMSTPSGREFMSFVLHELCGLYRPVANAAFDPHALHYREGARAVGVELHKMLAQHAQNQYVVLIAEHLDKG